MKLLRVSYGANYPDYVEARYKHKWCTFYKTGKYLPWQDPVGFSLSRYVLIGEKL